MIWQPFQWKIWWSTWNMRVSQYHMFRHIHICSILAWDQISVGDEMSILFGIDWQHGADPLVTSSAGFPWFVAGSTPNAIGGNASIADWSRWSLDLALCQLCGHFKIYNSFVCHVYIYIHTYIYNIHIYIYIYIYIDSSIYDRILHIHIFIMRYRCAPRNALPYLGTDRPLRALRQLPGHHGPYAGYVW
jgi:hypothetical protein